MLLMLGEIMTKFKQLLLASGFTEPMLVKELADRFNWHKYQQQVSQWANGIRLPDIESVYYMSIILQVSCEALIKIFLEMKYAR